MGAGFATAGALAIVFAAGAADEAAGGFAAATVFALLGVDFVAVVSVGDVAEALPEAASALAAFLEDFFVDWVSVAATPEAADEVVVSFDLAAEGFFVEEVSALVADEAAAEAVSAFFFLEDLDVDVSEGVAEVSGASPVGFLDFFAFLVDVEDD